MTFHQLNIFKHVVEFGSVTKASAHIGIPQPAASRAIRALEDEFGLALFDRSGTSIVVNENGQLLYEYAKQVLRLTSGLTSAMLTRKEQEDSTISIIVEAASYLFPHICTAFIEKHDDAKFRLLHQATYGRIEKTGYPMQLFSSRERPTDEDTFVLAEEEIKLAVQRDGPFGNRQQIALAEVSDMGFVSLFKTRGLRQITDHYCELAGFEPRVIFETDNTTTVTRYVNSGHGIAFIPELTWPKEIRGDEHVHLLSITEPVCRRFINLSTLDRRELSKYEILFADFLIDYFRKLSMSQESA
ncbi:MAG: LysR family transcriptional regulator [Clostridiaceae bacterium]|nr:LysR family transcriptional regulator [Clostridiaceae bacterium]